MRKSMWRPIGASSVPPPNQRDLTPGSAQAAKTRASGRSYVRSIVGGRVDDGSFRHRRPLRGQSACSARTAPSRSRRRSQVVRRSWIQRPATDSARLSIWQVRTRPTFSDQTSPRAPRTAMRWSTAGRHRERLRQLAHRRRPAAEPLDDRAPSRVGEGLEDEIQLRLRVNHPLEYPSGIEGMVNVADVAKSSGLSTSAKVGAQPVETSVRESWTPIS
jgi:hypothetical protein